MERRGSQSSPCRWKKFRGGVGGAGSGLNVGTRVRIEGDRLVRER